MPTLFDIPKIFKCLVPLEGLNDVNGTNILAGLVQASKAVGQYTFTLGSKSVTMIYNLHDDFFNKGVMVETEKCNWLKLNKEREKTPSNLGGVYYECTGEKPTIEQLGNITVLTDRSTNPIGMGFMGNNMGFMGNNYTIDNNNILWKDNSAVLVGVDADCDTHSVKQAFIKAVSYLNNLIQQPIVNTTDPTNAYCGNNDEDLIDLGILGKTSPNVLYAAGIIGGVVMIGASVMYVYSKRKHTSSKSVPLYRKADSEGAVINQDTEASKRNSDITDTNSFKKVQASTDSYSSAERVDNFDNGSSAIYSTINDRDGSSFGGSNRARSSSSLSTKSPYNYSVFYPLGDTDTHSIRSSISSFSKNSSKSPAHNGVAINIDRRQGEIYLSQGGQSLGSFPINDNAESVDVLSENKKRATVTLKPLETNNIGHVTRLLPMQDFQRKVYDNTPSKLSSNSFPINDNAESVDVLSENKKRATVTLKPLETNNIGHVTRLLPMQDFQRKVYDNTPSKLSSNKSQVNVLHTIHEENKTPTHLSKSLEEISSHGLELNKMGDSLGGIFSSAHNHNSSPADDSTPLMADSANDYHK